MNGRALSASRRVEAARRDHAARDHGDPRLVLGDCEHCRSAQRVARRLFLVGRGVDRYRLDR